MSNPYYTPQDHTYVLQHGQDPQALARAVHQHAQQQADQVQDVNLPGLHGASMVQQFDPQLVHQQAHHDATNGHLVHHPGVPGVPPGFPQGLPGGIPTAAEVQALAQAAGVAASSPGLDWDPTGKNKNGRRGRPPGARKGMKRGRDEDSDGEIKADFDSDDSDLEYNMDGMKTKYGRKVQKPSQYNPTTKTPTRRRGPGRRYLDTLFCTFCLRGHSPKSNRIVFCDGCNTPYHQLCHVPQIDSLLIDVADAEWYCNDCEARRAEKPLVTGLSGKELTDEEKKIYLASLPTAHLVELVLFSERSFPDVPIYPPNVKDVLAEIAAAKEAALQAEKEAARAAELPGNIGEIPADLEGPAQSAQPGVALPSYEQMIVRGLAEINEPKGTPPRVIYKWMETNYPLEPNFRQTAALVLQKAVKKGRLEKAGHYYKINPDYVPTEEDLAAATNDTTTAALAAVTADAVPAEPAAPGIPPDFTPQPGEGIRIPPAADDEENLLVDDDSTDVFSHHVNPETEKPIAEDAAMVEAALSATEEPVAAAADALPEAASVEEPPMLDNTVVVPEELTAESLMNYDAEMQG
ncbi:hypothetical protein YB2330_004099 [Saitoella coloradoensis]